MKKRLIIPDLVPKAMIFSALKSRFLDGKIIDEENQNEFPEAWLEDVWHENVWLCRDCGNEINKGEAFCFGICDKCWGKAHPAKEPAKTFEEMFEEFSNFKTW
ncbi:unnamed protein product, partial [marine sediment metagenome]